LRKVLPGTHVLFLIGAAALAGLPPLAGFFSKDGILSVLAAASQDGEYGTQFRVLLGIGFVTALMTAVYTSRAYFSTFLGAEKLPEEAGHHAHEASQIMLVPMGILAVGAVLAGVLLGPTSGIANYLQQSFESAGHAEHHEELWVMAVSAGLAIIGIGIGYYLSKLTPSTSDAGALVALADFGRNRLYIDWLYDVGIVRPLEWFAGLLGWFDEHFIDSLAMQIASVPRLLGLIGQRVQNGRVPGYTYFTAVGIAAVAVWIATR
jgi:NADH:ubiquinone oxidoreductase subunit 5 (subunit L)/multisubunit Na+/H+ antiporter MnhA subunit